MIIEYFYCSIKWYFGHEVDSSVRFGGRANGDTAPPTGGWGCLAGAHKAYSVLYISR
jgi:hypothetical protein